MFGNLWLCRVRRLVKAFGRNGEDLDALLGHPDRVLELGRQRAIASDRSPSVGKDLHVRPAEIDHRLDGKQHARLEHQSFTGTADVDDVRLIVKEPAEAVTAENYQLETAM